MNMTRCSARLLFASVCAVAFAAMADGSAAADPQVVWVKADKAAFEAQGVIGDGTEENPFNTIQKGIDTVAVGGTVKIMAGTYDYDEQFDGEHTNRVIITKRVIIDGVDGKDVTHIVGKLSNVQLDESPYYIGHGSDAIRCVKTSGVSVNGSIMKNLTLRNGGSGLKSGTSFQNGGAVHHHDNSNNPFYLVDCVVSNCAAALGGAINGVWAIRCVFDNCRSTSWGAAAKHSRLLHCLFTHNRRYGTSNYRPTIYRSHVINCTVVGDYKQYHSGIENDGTTFEGYVCNTISFYHRSANISIKDGYELNCYKSTSSSFPFVDADNGDFRLKLETGVETSKAIGQGSSIHFSKFFKGVTVELPEGIELNVDLAGNEFDITKPTCDIGCYQRILDWYVDAENGDDGNSGSVSRLPMKTLAAIMPKTLPGDTVHAAAGTYDEGVMRKSETTAKARVVVPSNVTLVADQGAENTFIVGAPDTTESANEYGLGTNAVRCVHLRENSKIKGFTVTGGYTWKDETLEGFSNNNRSGGGICGDNVTSSIAEECMISNNWASYSGGGVFYATAIRSYLFENHSLYNGSALYDGKLYGCVVDKNYTGFSTSTRPSACWSHRAIVNCTLGPNIYTHDGGNDGCVLTGEGSEAIFSYNIVMGAMGAYSKNYRLVGCIFKGTGGNWVSKMDGCIVNAGDSIALDENYRPIVGQSIAVDRVEAANIADATGGLLPLDKDLSGFQRMMNGKIDVGALEGDWSGVYAKLLDGFGNRIEIKAADSGVVTNEVNGTASLSLHDKEAVELVWWSEQPNARRKALVSVSGDGTLSVTRNGEAFASVTALASPAVVSVPCDGNGDCEFAFSFAGTGSADIYGFESGRGLAISIR